MYWQLNFQSNIKTEKISDIQDENKRKSNFKMKNNLPKSIIKFKCNFVDCKKEYSNKSRLEIHTRTHVSTF